MSQVPPENTVSDIVKPAMMPGVNGGQLQIGNPGNAGGGRKASEIRRLYRDGSFHAAQELKRRLETTAIVEAMTMTDLCQGANSTGKYGLGEAAVELNDDKVIKALAEFAATKLGDQAEAFVKGFGEFLSDGVEGN